MSKVKITHYKEMKTYDTKEDNMRNKLDVKMYCAKHSDTELNFSTI